MSMPSTIFLRKCLLGGFVFVLSLHPWILYGLRGPSSDGIRLLYSAVGKFGLMDIGWEDLLLTGGVSLFLAPILYIVRGPYFFWIGSAILAMSTLLGTFYFWAIFRQLLTSFWSASVAILLVAMHPFIHQMQYFWMTEAAYIAFLLFGLYQASVYIVSGLRSSIVKSSFFLFLAVVARPQACLAYPLVTCVVLIAAIRPLGGEIMISLKRRFADVILFVLLGASLSIPIRYLNHLHHGTWQFSKYLGKNLTFYLHGAYDRDNGPVSAQLWERSNSILNDHAWTQLGQQKLQCGGLRGETNDSSLYVPPIENLQLWAKRPCEHPFWFYLYQKAYNEAIDITGYYHVTSYLGPSTIFYLFTNDWSRSDDLAVQVWWEAVKKHPLRYLQWGSHWSKGYFTWMSENPNEWHAGFASRYMLDDYAKNERCVLPLHSGMIEGRAWGGLAFTYPKIVNIYSLMRRVYSDFMTYVKKTTIVFSPFLILIAFRAGRPLHFWFLVTSLAVHLVSASSMAFVVGFHHRYSMPMEFFSIFYLASWIDFTIQRYSNRQSSDELRRVPSI